MNTQSEIDRHEREFKDLLTRVMREPLTPVVESVRGLDARLGAMTDLLQDLREVDLGTLHIHAEDVTKNFRKLKSCVEEGLLDVEHKMLPLFDTLLLQQDEGRRDLREHFVQLSAQSVQTAGAMQHHLASISDAIRIAHAVMTSTLLERSAQLSIAVETGLVEVKAQLLRDMSEQAEHAAQLAATNTEAQSDMLKWMGQITKDIQAEAAMDRLHAEQRNASLAASLSALQTLIATQTQECETMRQQQLTIAESGTRQMQRYQKLTVIWSLTCITAISAVYYGMPYL
ncbi:MAG: hypothetical protein V4723_07355 [Pseudomonadota bacterium]